MDAYIPRVVPEKLSRLYQVILSVALMMLFVAEASAERNFRMALFRNSDVNADTDVTWIFAGDPMPPAPRRVILDIGGWYLDSGLRSVLESYTQLDWSRIDAMIIDEPYWSALGSDANGNWATPCPGDPRLSKIAQTAANLENAANVLKSISPNTRMWINFSEPEALWMRDPDASCRQPFNQPYIDIVSIDKYDTSFEAVRPFYDWFATNRPKVSQQLALIPGAFYMTSNNIDHPNYRDDNTGASWLSEYFDYAQSMNSVSSGRWDEPPMIWMVAGWPGHTYDVYLSVADNQGAVALQSVWHSKWTEKRIEPPSNAQGTWLLLLR